MEGGKIWNEMYLLLSKRGMKPQHGCLPQDYVAQVMRICPKRSAKNTLFYNNGVLSLSSNKPQYLVNSPGHESWHYLCLTLKLVTIRLRSREN